MLPLPKSLKIACAASLKTRAEAAQLLRISDQAVSDRLAAGDLVGLKDGRVWKLPAWQFDADTENGWLPGIVDLRQHFPAGPVTLTAWVTAPNVDLGGRTPRPVERTARRHRAPAAYEPAAVRPRRHSASRS